MSEPPTDPLPTPDYELTYASASPYRNAPNLVRLAGIFALISAGLSFFVGVCMFAVGFFMNYLWTHPGAFGMAGPAAPPPPFRPIYLLIYYLFLGTGAVSVAIVKVIGGIKMLRLRRGAWGWGLAAGIAGCIELLWCSAGCVLPMAAGIFTIIILSFEHVRAYVRNETAKHA